MTKPVIIGMNNPYSEDPRLALAPFPRRSSGYRLWSYLNAVRPTPRAEYCQKFDRMNVLNKREWDPIAARDSLVDRFWETMQDCPVLILGDTVRRVLWLPHVSPLSWMETSSVRWCLIPYPSGLNRWYNDPLHRLAVGYRLEELL